MDYAEEAAGSQESHQIEKGGVGLRDCSCSRRKIELAGWARIQTWAECF